MEFRIHMDSYLQGMNKFAHFVIFGIILYKKENIILLQCNLFGTLMQIKVLVKITLQ